MTDIEQRKAAKIFAEQWKNKGYEKGESQTFWLQLLQDVFGVENVSQFIRFEDTVHIDKATGFIDAFIDKTKVLIEQKSIDKDLRKAIKQSDGSLLNPFQQAKRYSAELPYDDRPRWIITCNFKSFLVYDMNNPNGEPEEILLKDLAKEYYRLQFLVDSKSDHIKKEEELSFKAGELVGNLYDAFSKQYLNLENEQSQKDLNELCVRLVFCLYAEDAGLFGRKNVFHDYLAKYEDLNAMRKALIELFKILDTPLNRRDPYLEDDLNQFPYVNGGLFSNENIEIPTFTQEIRDIILARASDDFDWSEISPTIFGAVFESTLNPETRRSGGMHYTSIENIHKVIDPLFLDELREKLNEAEAYKNEKTRNEKLREFQNYIASLNFFDPACGSGNFLTETYLSLRRLENEALDIMSHGMMMLEFEDTIKVSIQQFYGIEINDFAVKVARTALWIAEAQMWSETRRIVSSLGNIGDFLPLESYDNIYEGNALRVDWNDVLPSFKCNYIMGNPPFVGYSHQNATQKYDIVNIFVDKKGKKLKNSGKIDYVAGWFWKAAEYIYNSRIKVAFVSTNSITQGEQVEAIWEPLFTIHNIEIIFAHRTFKWTSEANQKAGVSCVIIGIRFKNAQKETKIIFDNNLIISCNEISPYLLKDQNVIVHKSEKPICNIPKMMNGNRPVDGGNLLLSEEEYKNIIEKEPYCERFIKPCIGTTEFLYNSKRYCLWLVNCEPSELRKMPLVMERVEKVRKMRKDSSDNGTNNLANSPMLFREQNNPKSAIVVPVTTSENRRYIPMGFIDDSVITNNSLQIIPNASLYNFGVLMSNVHMAWMRTTTGRLESRYQYSAKVVYNNFPWPDPSDNQKEKIEETAQTILDVRAKYPNCSLADLYDEIAMPSELRKAHQENDKAVMDAYGWNWRKMTESECVAELMKLYQKIVNEEEII